MRREFGSFIRAWEKRFEAARRRRVELARQARSEARAIGRMLADRFGVDAVYLIGSALHEEEFDDSSDLDIAVRGLEPERYWEAVAAIEEMTRFPFDLIDLKAATKSLVDKVRREGAVLYGGRGEEAPQPCCGTGHGYAGGPDDSR
ncbi:MAG: nucleotidyltransferase domain-containing protein [Bacillota bacterium]